MEQQNTGPASPRLSRLVDQATNRHDDPSNLTDYFSFEPEEGPPEAACYVSFPREGDDTSTASGAHSPVEKTFIRPLVKIFFIPHSILIYPIVQRSHLPAKINKVLIAVFSILCSSNTITNVYDLNNPSILLTDIIPFFLLTTFFSQFSPYTGRFFPGRIPTKQTQGGRLAFFQVQIFNNSYFYAHTAARLMPMLWFPTKLPFYVSQWPHIQCFYKNNNPFPPLAVNVTIEAFTYLVLPLLLGFQWKLSYRNNFDEASFLKNIAPYLFFLHSPQQVLH